MNNMMRKNNNRGGDNKHRSGGNNGPRRYNNGGGNGGNRGANDSQNIQRQKHHATQQLGKYNDMARNAQINGDRVDVEYYLQHVDHYTRILTDIAAIEAERYAQQRESQIIPGGPNDPNAQQHQPQEGVHQHASGSEPSAPGEAPATDAAPAEAAAQPAQPAPRPRQPRRQPAPQAEPSDNGAREANANREEIPLPGSILPPI